MQRQCAESDEEQCETGKAGSEREVWGVTGTCVEMKKWNFHCFCVPSPPSVGKSVAFWLRFLLILNCVWASLRSRSVGLEVGEPGPVPAIASSLNCTHLAPGTGHRLSTVFHSTLFALKCRQAQSTGSYFLLSLSYSLTLPLSRCALCTLHCCWHCRLATPTKATRLRPLFASKSSLIHDAPF